MTARRHSIEIPPELSSRAPSVPSPSTDVTTSQAYAPFDHQIAGHAGQIFGLAGGLLAKVCPQKEVDFYKAVFASDREDLVEFRKSVPQFAGSGDLAADASLNGEAVGNPTVHLENLLAPYTHPSVADIKIGTRLYGDEADEAKKARMEEQARTTTSGKTGLRICGMKVYDPYTSNYLTHDRKYGRSLSAEEIHLGIRTFFTIPSSATLVPTATLTALREKLTILLHRLETARVRLYGASILLIYEGSDVDARIIDFAHSHVESEQAGPDEGAVFGVRNLLQSIEKLLQME
ncbi:uncharacterized protein SPPG_04123 [Spizellomyces punctatus DAOM BR117]|uniref:Kinase n=1 Tax=Spizellomyces punctatus (strain DAOM BR117) TaxID=645134 RepID=A0A0L0HJG0_SPIPD|nr:uncharacterized protein SPPG_04123 [Spizellomyces punctatus DAOM BR117]KND01030.1 hypothetical protein SPPG_04123 [Spizellomyces punctatus DAOM BR117]|eukprot:XP_016609069.1 hypothetical protein SPPG_04123 [Spizellomyces punctatus DAOM BR117]